MEINNLPKVAKNAFLMAEDNPLDAELFSEMLYKAFGGEYSVVCVDRFEKVAEALRADTFEALILDMDLPDRSGVDNVFEIGKQYPSLPIVVLTGNDDLDLAIHSLQKGAQDYLSKNNVTSEMLARSLNYAKERKQIEQKLKEALEDAAYKNVQLEAQAKHDSLTGLANRAYFQDASSRVLHRADRNSERVALLYFDLDGFKKVNDTYGHIAGDDLLKQVSIRLKDIVRNSDFLARLGGDEFVIITDTLESKNEIYPLVKRIQDQFDFAFRIGPHEMFINTSIGIAFYPDADNLDLLIKHADCAMYEAKNNPNSSICFYSEQIARQYSRSQKIESSLSNALEGRELIAVFQPVINVNNPNEIHVEALARWHSRSLGDVSPEEFIPIAESTPVINGITQAVTGRSKDFYRSILDNGLKVDRISINVSASQIASDHFCNTFIQWLEDQNLPAKKVCLELTERQVVQNSRKCQQQFTFLRAHGIKIALDDFGSGFSSITHLLDLPFDVLKLDQILIDHIDSNSRNEALVAGIIEMAHRLDMQVVAEGIQREEEKKKMIEIGCDHLQGYHISQPLPLEEAVLFYELRK